MLRVGLIGCGRRGAALLPPLLAAPGVKVVGVGDADPAAIERVVRDTGLPCFDTNHSTWTVRPDVIVIATPPQGRVELVQRFAEPGVRAMLVEKPLALSLWEADRMLDACAAAGIQLSVGQHWRFCPALGRLKELVAAGRLGRIETIHATCFGNLLDQGWHLLDAVRWLLGGPRVEWAGAHGTSDVDALISLAELDTPPQADPHHPAPIWTIAELGLQDDVRLRVEAGPLIQKTGADLGDWHERRLRLVGSLGTAECRPGHYLRFDPIDGERENLQFDPSSLEDATRNMVHAVCSAAQGGSDVSSPAADARQTLEGLVLCGCSLRDGRLASAPLAAHNDPWGDLPRQFSPHARRHPAPISDRRAPRYSVLIPLIEDRGFAHQSLAGWLNQEGFATEGYELLLLDDGTRTESADRLRRELRVGDRVVLAEGVNRSELYDAGTQAARGEFVLLTESHCIPDPDCLRELERCLEARDLDGACLRSIPVCYNSLARADAVAFETGFREFRTDEDWRKVNVHGFAIRRDLYQLVGGLQGRYTGYAEMVLAADLRDAGVRIGYAAGAAVQHHYRVSLAEVVEFVDNFVLGEVQYLHDHGSVERIGFSYLEMCGGRLESMVALDECLRAEWRRLRRGVCRGDFSAVGSAVSLARRRLMAGRLGRAIARVRIWKERAACWFLQRDVDRMTAAYRKLFAAAVHRAHLRALNRIRWDETFSAPLELGIDEWPEDWLFGFHPPEAENGCVFRWSGTVAGIDLPLQAGEYIVTLRTGNVRPWPGSLRWTLSGRPIPDEDVVLDARSCRIRVTVPQRQSTERKTLGLSCRPWDVNDERRLGIPIFGLKIRRGSSLADAEPDIDPALRAAAVSLPIRRAA